MPRKMISAAAFALAVLGTLLAGQGQAQAAQRHAAPQYAPKYDGEWSVVIITDWGTCDRAYRYPVRIVNGNIRYENPAGITISGRVDARGRLNAVIRSGDQHASGAGRLTATGGSGTWSGQGRNSACRGRWEAERRG